MLARRAGVSPPGPRSSPPRRRPNCSERRKAPTGFFYRKPKCLLTKQPGGSARRASNQLAGHYPISHAIKCKLEWKLSNALQARPRRCGGAPARIPHPVCAAIPPWKFGPLEVAASATKLRIPRSSPHQRPTASPLIPGSSATNFPTVELRKKQVV